LYPQLGCVADGFEVVDQQDDDDDETCASRRTRGIPQTFKRKPASWTNSASARRRSRERGCGKVPQDLGAGADADVSGMSDHELNAEILRLAADITARKVRRSS
jgi:hypothetical protein